MELLTSTVSGAKLAQQAGKMNMMPWQSLPSSSVLRLGFGEFETQQVIITSSESSESYLIPQVSWLETTYQSVVDL